MSYIGNLFLTQGCWDSFFSYVFFQRFYSISFYTLGLWSILSSLLYIVWAKGSGNGIPLQYPCLENPWTEEPGRLQSMGSRRVRHDWATSLSLFSFMHWRRKWQPTPVFLPGGAQGQGSLVGCCLWGCTKLDTTEWLHFHFYLYALEKEMATHSSVLAWRIPGTGEPGGLLSMRLHRVGHDWSDLAAAAACLDYYSLLMSLEINVNVSPSTLFFSKLFGCSRLFTYMPFIGLWKFFSIPGLMKF